MFSTSELPAIVIASQLLIRHLIRELQLVYLNLLDLLDYHLDVLHDHLLGGPFHGDFDFYDLLMTSSASSGDVSTSLSSTRGTSSLWRNPCSFQPAVTLSQLELICHHFHQLGNTSFSNLITRIGFWDSRILPSPLLEQLDHNFACCWPCSFFHGFCFFCGCFSSSWVLGSRPWLFFSLFTSIWHVASGESSAHLLADSFSACFKHTLLNTSLALL